MLMKPCPRCKRLIPHGQTYRDACAPIAKAQAAEARERKAEYRKKKYNAKYNSRRDPKYLTSTGPRSGESQAVHIFKRPGINVRRDWKAANTSPQRFTTNRRSKPTRVGTADWNGTIWRPYAQAVTIEDTCD